MIEARIIDALSGALDVPVYGEVPKNKPESFVTVEKTGGFRENLLRHATVAVQSWSGTKEGAAALSESVIAAMDDFYRTGDVGAVRLSGDYDFTDASTKAYRYQAVFDLTY